VLIVGEFSKPHEWLPWLLNIIKFLLEARRYICSPRLVAHNLPGMARPPIGRDEELKQLRRYLSPHTPTTVCVLWGPGGAGKTCLALALAHEYRRRAESCLERLWERFRPYPLGFFEAIVYISGQARTIYGPPSRYVRRQLPEITAEIARTLNDQELLRQPPPRREQSVLAALSRRRILLIVDGIEDMDLDLVLDFIRRVPSPSRVLITSRHRILIDEGWPEVHLEVLDPESARRLIRLEAKEKDLKLTPEEVKQLAQAASGLPLAIVIGIAWLRGGMRIEMVLDRLQRGHGELAENLVERSVRDLRHDQNVYPLFLALALFDPEAGARREALGAVAGLPEDQREAGLMRLWNLSLIEPIEDGRSAAEARPGPSRRPRGSRPHAADRFRFRHPLIHAYAVRALEGDPRFHDFRQRWIEWYQARLAERPQNIPLLRAERPNLLRILEALRQEDRMEELARCLWEARILLDEGPAEPYLEAIRSLFRWSLKRLRGDLLQGLTWDPLTRGGPVWKKEFAEQWWELLRPYLSDSHQAAIEARLLLWGESPEPIPLERVRSLLEGVFQGLKPERSEVEAEQAISVCNDSGLLLMGDRGGEPDYPAARAWFERGLELLRQHRDRLQDPKEREAILRGNLALLIARAEGRYAEAMRILEEIRPHLRWKRDLAEWHLAMAVYAYRRCRMREALRYGREGDALLRELGREELGTREGQEWPRIRARLNRPLGWIREWILCLLRRA